MEALKDQLDTVRRVWYLGIATSSAILLIGLSGTSATRYSSALYALRLLPAMEASRVKKLVAEYNNRVRTEVPRADSNARSRILDSRVRNRLADYSLDTLRQQFYRPPDSISISDDPSVGELAEILGLLYRSSGVPDPDSFLARLDSKIPKDCVKCPITGMGGRGETLATSAFQLRGEERWISLGPMPEPESLGRAREGLLDTMRGAPPGEAQIADSLLLKYFLRQQSRNLFGSSWPEFRDLSWRDAMSLAEARHREGRKTLTLLGIPIDSDVAGTWAPIILVILSGYQILHLKNLQRGLMSGNHLPQFYPWPPLFAGGYGVVAVCAASLFLPLLSLVLLLKRLFKVRAELEYAGAPVDWPLKAVVLALVGMAATALVTREIFGVRKLIGLPDSRPGSPTRGPSEHT